VKFCVSPCVRSCNGFQSTSVLFVARCNLLSLVLKVNIAPCLVKQQRTNAYAGLETQLHSFLSWALDTEPPVSRAALCAMDERKSLTAGSLYGGRTAACNVVHPFIALSWIYREYVTHETRFVGILSCLLSVQVPHWQRHSAGHSLLILCSAPTGTCRTSERWDMALTNVGRDDRVKVLIV